MELIVSSMPEQRALASGAGAFPLVLSPKTGSGSASELMCWCSKNSRQLRSLAERHGAVLFRGCNIKGADDFALVTRALGCEGYDYVGGAAPRTELVPGVVFTSNESPPDQPIPFHHELAQAQCPPAYILFFCEREAKSGGATPIIPSEEVAQFFVQKYPELAKKVEQLGVRYIRVMPEVTDQTSAQGRSWKETYNVTSRQEAEAVMKKQGTSFEWMPNGDCRTVTAALPALREDPRSGRLVFFNSVVAAYTGWNDARNIGEKAVVLGDGSAFDGDAVRDVARFMQEKLVAFRWHKGDVILIDNTLVMHSRQTFEPPRRVLAALRGPPMLGAADESKALRIGIIGTGAMGKEHIRNIALLGRGRAIVVAIADSDARGRTEAVDELGREQGSAAAVFDCEDDLIACDFVDAILVCTPNFQHLQALRKAIPTGKHILCEKPLCTTVEDCEEVESLLAKHRSGPGSGIFMTGMEYRWMPPIAKLIQETDSGEHGAVRMISIREHRFPFLEKVNNWNRFNKYTGGTLVEKACHFFDLMRRIAQSDPVSVFASGGQAMNHKDEVLDEGMPDIIDHAFAVVEFANGARGSLDLCMFAEDEQTEQVTAVCERGKIEAKSPESTVRIIRRNQVSGLGRIPPPAHQRAVPELRKLPVPAELAMAGFHEGATYFELQEFVAAAVGERAVPVSARDGKLAVAMGAAAQLSIATGLVVRLDQEGRPLERADLSSASAMEVALLGEQGNITAAQRRSRL